MASDLRQTTLRTRKIRSGTKTLNCKSSITTFNIIYGANWCYSRGVLETDSITLQIYDKDILKKDDFLGEVRLTSTEFVNGNDRWYTLQSRDYKSDRVHGELHLRIQTYY